MAKSPVQSAITKWNSLIPQLQAAGVDKKHYENLAQMDIGNVQKNKPGLSNTEIQDMINASVQGKAQINPYDHPSTGLGDLIGNAFSDLRNAAFDFVPGTINLASKLSPISLHEGLGNPLQAPELLDDFRKVVQQDPITLHKYGLDDPSLNILEYISKAPLGNLIPGLHTAADLTTDTGRKELEAHPGYAALDVLPYASAAGKAATAGVEFADTAAEAAETGKPLSESASIKEGLAPAPQSAFQAGRVVRGAARGIYDLASDTRLPLPDRQVITDILNRSSFSKRAVDAVMKPMRAAQSAAEHKSTEMVRDWAATVTALPEAERDAVTAAVARGTVPSSLSEEAQTIARAGIAINDQVQAATIRHGENVLVPAPPQAAQPGAPFVWPKDHPVATSYQKLTETQRLAGLRAEQLRAATARHNALLQELQAKQTRGEVLNSADRGRLEAGAQNIAKKQERFQRSAQLLETRTARHIAAYEGPEGVPAVYHPLVREDIQNKLFANLSDRVTQGQLTQAEYDEAVKLVNISPSGTRLREIVGDKEMNAIYASGSRLWQDADRLRAKGVDERPSFIHNATMHENEIFRPNITGREHRMAVTKTKMFNMGNSSMDIVVGTVKNVNDLVSYEGNKEVFTQHIEPVLLTHDKIIDKYTKLAETLHRGVPVPGYGRATGRLAGETIEQTAQRLLLKDNVAFENGDTMFGMGGFVPQDGQVRYMPRDFAKALDSMTGQKGIPFIGNRSPLTRVFRYSVTTGPRHMAHIGLGGLVMGLTYDPAFVTQLGSAWRLIRSVNRGEEPFIAEIMGQHINHIEPRDILSYASGKSQGRIISAIKGVPDTMNRAEEFLTTLYKTSEFLSGQKHGMERAEALDLANKVFVDVSSQTAFEQAWLTSVFPFWGFTRHVVRYMANLAVDHPLKTSILSNVARIQQNSFSSALPGTWQTLFFLGSQDSSGNQFAVDYKSLNPFRTTFNMSTLAGFFSSMNPAMEAGLKVLGVNPLSATPELYPHLHYDPQSGQMVADRSGSSTLSNILGSFVPETSVLDATFSLSDNYKNLSTGDPNTFYRFLMSSLNIPFGVSQYNVPQEMQKLEKARFVQAQKDVSSALTNNDFARLAGYNQVPTPSKLVKLGLPAYIAPSQLQRVWELLLTRQKGTNIDPRAALPARR